MANFKGHLSSAAAIGGLAAAAGYYVGHLDPHQAGTCFALATIGGLSPDIDSDNSHSIRVVFNVITGAILVVSTALGYVWYGIAGALAFRYGLIWPFKWLSVHRGIWHSVPMALACSMSIYALADYMDDPAAQWYGRFFFLGFIIHLIVDEIYGIGKRSQWTALKFWGNDNGLGYFMLYFLSVILFVKAYV